MYGVTSLKKLLKCGWHPKILQQCIRNVLIIIIDRLEISSIKANKKETLLPSIYTKNLLKFLWRVYLDGMIHQSWLFQKSSKYLAPLVELQIALLKLLVIDNGNLHSLSLSLRSTPGMHSNITPGSPLEKPSLFFLRE